MALSNDLISQFAKITKDDKKEKTETTVYGTTVEYNGSTYVQLDGSDLLTPISTTADTNPGERVTVMIKNHTATITGNISSPAARSGDVEEVSDSVAKKISEFEIIVANAVNAEQLNVEKARIDALEADNVTINQSLKAAEGDIDALQTNVLNVSEKVTANEATIEKLATDKLDASIANITYATIKALEATDLNVYNLSSTYAEFSTTTTNKFKSVDASITKLDTEKLSSEEAMLTYANIDFSNIGQAAMEYFYANSGLIENVVVSNGNITGVLAGVTIRGDLIEANTLVADKLVIQGEDGLYYKLNTNGETISNEQTEYNSLNGQVILAKSITAEKVNVDDLVAFDATIGGFNITEDAIFSEVKDSEDNVTRGIYMDTDGQVNFGDADKFIKYYRAEDGTYKLAISADSILYTLNGKQLSVADLGIIGEYVHIGTYEDEPCIELGESDSEFKLRITNTRMIFTEGSKILAYFNNQSLHISKAVIEEELQQGGFVWKVRSNGNMGLMWKGVIS